MRSKIEILGMFNHILKHPDIVKVEFLDPTELHSLSIEEEHLLVIRENYTEQEIEEEIVEAYKYLKSKEVSELFIELKQIYEQSTKN
jgi:exopolysaccharide biosynthesis predicted pyruvyltransferase EpsI